MINQFADDVIYVDIVEKSRIGWRIIGICPESVCLSGSLHVYAGRRARVVDSATDEVITTGHSLYDVLAHLAIKTGLTVVLTDEATEREHLIMPPVVRHD